MDYPHPGFPRNGIGVRTSMGSPTILDQVRQILPVIDDDSTRQGRGIKSCAVAVDVASAFAGEDDHEFLQLVIPATLQNHLMKVSGLDFS